MRNSNIESILWKIKILKKNWTKNSKNSRFWKTFFKQWHVVYQIEGIFDREFKYEIHFVEKSIFSTNAGMLVVNRACSAGYTGTDQTPKSHE